MNDPTSCDRCGKPHVACHAHSKNGEPCGQPKMRGQKICRKHGGKAAQNLAAAERRVVDAEARSILTRLLHDPNAPPVIDPLLRLREVVGRIGHAVDELGLRVNDLSSIDYTDTNMVRRMNVTVEAWRDLTVEYRRSLTDMVRLGIEDRVAAATEAQVSLLFAMVERVFARLDLSVEQRVIAGRVLHEELLAPDAEGVGAA